MPALADRVGADLNGYEPVAAPSSPTGSMPSKSQEPGFTGFTLSPLPLLSNSSSDNLRTYYQNGVVPQFRLSNPAPVAVQQTINNVTQVVNKITQAASSSGGGFSGVISSPGYIIFPFPTTQPLILQWGLTPTPTTSGTQGTISFPIPFISTVLGIEMTAEQVVGQHTTVANPIQGTITPTGFQWTIGTGTDTDGLCPAFWWAWGQ